MVRADDGNQFRISGCKQLEGWKREPDLCHVQCPVGRCNPPKDDGPQRGCVSPPDFVCERTKSERRLWKISDLESFRLGAHGPCLLLADLPHPSSCSTRARAVCADTRHDSPTDGWPEGERVSSSTCVCKTQGKAQVRVRRELGGGERMMEGDIVVSQRELPGSAGFVSYQKPI